MPMTASPDDQARLLELQNLDTRLRQLDHRLSNLPETAELAALEEERAELRRRRAEQTGRAEDARAELSRVESDVAVVEKRIARDEERLAVSTSAKDAQALEGELVALRRRLGDLEEIQLIVMERLEAITAELAETSAANDDLEGRVAAVTERRDASAGTAGVERLAASDARQALAASLPEDLIALYERQRARYGFGASLLRARTTTATGVELTGSDLARVRSAAADEVILCPDSQAILVRTAESGL